MTKKEILTLVTDYHAWSILQRIQQEANWLANGYFTEYERKYHAKELNSLIKLLKRELKAIDDVDITEEE